MTQKKTAAQMRLSGADRKDPKRYAQRLQEERRAALGLPSVAPKTAAAVTPASKRVQSKLRSERQNPATKVAAASKSRQKIARALVGVGEPPPEFDVAQRAAWLEIAAAAPVPLSEAHAPLLGQAACLQAEMMVAGADFGAIRHSTLTQILIDLTVRRLVALPVEPETDAGPKPLIEQFGEFARAIERVEQVERAAAPRAGNGPKRLAAEMRSSLAWLKEAWAAWSAEQARKLSRLPAQESKGAARNPATPISMPPLGEPPEEFSDEQRAAWQRIVVASAVELTSTHRPLMRQCSVLSAESLSSGADFAAGKHQCLRRLLRDLTLPPGPEPSGAAEASAAPATVAAVLDVHFSAFDPFACFRDPLFSTRGNYGNSKASQVKFAVLEAHKHWRGAFGAQSMP
ncbi:hypothetical protein [Paraburkholderia phosphatilytica]|uniref:hypothetical protein n=1 Tax=Paraburkholderia phosphatilytica TaxID=2282883 RepID=UPI000E4BAD74|nr:hypothetical protein [Paraburkholderia phosphatilytica]